MAWTDHPLTQLGAGAAGGGHGQGSGTWPSSATGRRWGCASSATGRRWETCLGRNLELRRGAGIEDLGPAQRKQADALIGPARAVGDRKGRAQAWAGAGVI
jgi:hypothetical protein